MNAPLEQQAPLQVRELQLDDYLAMADVYRRNRLMEPIDPPPVQPEQDPYYERWRHLWIGNPAIDPLDSRWPKGWVLEAKDGNIVGSILNIPFRYRLGADTLLCAGSGGWAVDTEYRADSLRLLNHFVRQEVDLLVTTSPSGVARKIFSMYKFRTHPLPSYDTKLIFVLRYNKYMAEALPRHPRIFYNRLLRPVLSQLYFLRDFYAGRGRFSWRRPGKGVFDVEPVDSFDERFDALWMLTLAAHPDRLLLERDSKSLTWHFGFALKAQEARAYLLMKSGQPKGYAIFRYRTRNRIKRAILADLQIVPGSEASLSSLFEAAAHDFDADKVALLEVTGFSDFKRDLIESFKPYRKPMMPQSYLYRLKRRELQPILDQAQTWDPCLIEGDATL